MGIRECEIKGSQTLKHIPQEEQDIPGENKPDAPIYEKFQPTKYGQDPNHRQE